MILHLYNSGMSNIVCSPNLLLVIDRANKLKFWSIYYKYVRYLYTFALPALRLRLSRTLSAT